MLSNFIEGRLGFEADLMVVHPSGDLTWEIRDRRPALFPGSFNPLHPGHRSVHAAAELMLGRRVLYEVSVTNVDKPPLDVASLRERLDTFYNEGVSVVLTRAPLFTDKARLVPGATFVVGFDTAARICSDRYGDPVETLSYVASRGGRFLLAPRLSSVSGESMGLADLEIPAGFEAMFTEIPQAMYVDEGHSSTKARAERA